VATFDFFFVPPYMTFAVRDTQYVFTFAVMLVVGLLISTLAVRVRAQAEAARSREERTQALYAMSRDLAAARSSEEVAQAASRHVAHALQGDAFVLLPGAGGRLIPQDPGSSADARETAVAQWAFDHGQLAGMGTDTLPGASALHVPLRGTQSVLGVLALRPSARLLPLAPDQLSLIESLAHQAASGLERVRLASEAERARLAVETERLRSTLLSSVSHDLRTPLAAITGAASTLLESRPLGPDVERDLKEAIREEAERLNRLVTNLLDMTRLDSGSVSLHRDWESLEELVGTALTRLEKALAGRPVSVAIAHDLPPVPVDGVLVEQVLVNLLDNALKYTPAGSPLSVTARSEAADVLVEVADEGPGLPPGAEEQVFEKFYRGGQTPRGFGLGLPICKAIVTAHGGRIWAENRSPRGAAFRFTLPKGEAPVPATESVSDYERS
jgi:two-component system sensor histidine kinase KdpD